MANLVLLRHGESAWNRENRFTGWADVDLTEWGCSEAKRAGTLLKAEGFMFDAAYTSLLKRGHPDALDRAGRDRPDVGPCGAVVAAERAALRSAPGTQQGRDSEALR